MDKTKDQITELGKKILHEINVLGKKPYVKVGFPREKGDKKKTSFSDEHKPEPGESKTAKRLSVGQIAVIHEFGSSDGTIPSRPALRGTFDKNKGRYIKLTANHRKRIMAGGETVAKALGLMGQEMSSDVKSTIKARIAPPLKPATLKRKMNAKGQIADVPLIWKGQLVNSITYKTEINGDNK